MSTGRTSIGSDLNELATFVSTVKTTPLHEVELASVSRWIGRLEFALADDIIAPTFSEWSELGYFKDLDGESATAIHRLIACALGSVDTVRSAATKRFIRCVILRTAQWALDMRREVPSPEDFRIELRTQGLVLYHRWKLRGRREIPAPYWIADRRDGHGLSRYTMGARAEPTQRSYFAQLEAAFKDIAKIASRSTTVVQVVGFNGGPDQLHRYLAAMETAGFKEKLYPHLATGDDGRLWRDVPNRRWWNEARVKNGMNLHTSREVVLIHTLKR
jgi:hypothetical protein